MTLDYYVRHHAWPSSGSSGQDTSHPRSSTQHTAPDDIIDVTQADEYPPAFVRIHLSKSKTDPYRKGVHVYLGITKHSICPVSAILSFMAIRPHHITGPLFRYPDGTTLTRNHFVQQINLNVKNSTHRGVKNCWRNMGRRGLD